MLGSVVCMYGIAVDRNVLLWLGVVFNALAHLMTAFAQVNNDQLRDVMKAIKATGRELSSDEDCPDAGSAVTTYKQPVVSTCNVSY